MWHTRYVKSAKVAFLLAKHESNHDVTSQAALQRKDFFKLEYETVWDVKSRLEP